MEAGLPADRLLAIIQTQNEIAATTLDLEAVMSLVVERARALTGAAAAVVELIDGEDLVSHVGDGLVAAYDGLRLRLDASLSGLCVRQGQVLHCSDSRGDDRVNSEACRQLGAISMVCVPLQHNHRIVGVLKLHDPRAGAFTEDDVATLDLLSGVIASHMAHATEFQLHQHASRHDALTGLPNRRAFDERLEAELTRVRRRHGRSALGLLDIDGFKAINDRHGHVAGDAVLRAVAVNLARLRTEDAAYRIGGDEFALVLVHGSAAGARTVIERLSSSIDADADCRGVRLSWGVADLHGGDNVASILARADAALYAAKRPIAV